MIVDCNEFCDDLEHGLGIGQWLVFRDSGQITGADYAKAASQATSKGEAVGQWDFFDRFDPERPILRRKIYITKLLRGVFNGLAFMHSNGRLHQSLGPASIILKLVPITL